MAFCQNCSKRFTLFPHMVCIFSWWFRNEVWGKEKGVFSDSVDAMLEQNISRDFSMRLSFIGGLIYQRNFQNSTVFQALLPYVPAAIIHASSGSGRRCLTLPRKFPLSIFRGRRTPLATVTAAITSYSRIQLWIYPWKNSEKLEIFGDIRVAIVQGSCLWSAQLYCRGYYLRK